MDSIDGGSWPEKPADPPDGSLAIPASARVP